jgi:filamentous hemagglutinin
LLVGANSSFTPAVRSGLEFETTIKVQTDRLTSYDISTNQRIMKDGTIVDGGYSRSSIRTTFDKDSGHLYIDNMEAQPGRHIGREMISNVIESIGPKNVRSIGAEFAYTNKEVFTSRMAEGATAGNAAMHTPLGKALRDLGYQLKTVDPTAYPRPTIHYVPR